VKADKEGGCTDDGFLRLSYGFLKKGKYIYKEGKCISDLAMENEGRREGLFISIIK
jgi:hypothetical protein